MSASMAMLGAACSDDGGGDDDDPRGGAGQGGAGAAQAGGGATQGGAGGSGAGSGGTQAGAGSPTGGSTGNPNAPLFMQAPNCDPDAANLEGTFQGMPVTQNGSLSTNTLESLAYYTVQTTPRSNLRLEWKNPLQPNVVQPLSGGYFLTRWDAANRNVLYCIVAGEIGALPTDRAQDDYFKFSITRARAGEVGETPFAEPARCDGAELDVDLKGCVYRYAN